ncbi:MAG: efflux RND transporter permease subunit [Bacteroidales bacterium]|nr:efflux RND transporter permease subunit [Bacteroidales bacterium]
MKNKLLNKPYRYFLIVIPVILFLAFLIPLKDAKINPDLMRYTPQGTESKLNIEKTEDVFGKYDPVIVVFKADDIIDGGVLEKLSSIHDEISNDEMFSDVISVFTSKHIRSQDGFMLVDPAINIIPENEEEKEELRAYVKSNTLAYKLLVSENFKYTVMIINPEEGFSDSEIIAKVEEIVTKTWGAKNYDITGMLYLRDVVQEKATRDLMFLMPLALLIMIVFLFISFREKRGVFLPMLVVIFSTGISMGLMPLMGYELSLIAVLIPILMISIANNYGVHIISKYQELNALYPERSMDQIVKESVNSLSKPILLTGLTTIAGVLGLLVHIMEPAVQMGVVCSIGIAFALYLSLYFLPAILIGMKKGKPQKSFNGQRNSPIDKLLKLASSLVLTKSKTIIIVFSSIFVLAAVGTTRLEVTINNEKLMPASHSIRKATEVMNTYFGGTKTISVMFEGDIKSPEVINDMVKLEETVKQFPQTGNVNSLASILKIMSKALNDPSDPAYGEIPETRDGIAQYIEFYNMSGDPEDFEKFVDFNFEKAIVNIQFHAKNIKEYNEVANAISDFCKNSEHAKFESGISLVEKDMAISIAQGQIYSLILAFTAILLLMWMIFRSFKTGLIGCIPLVFTIVCNFGLMGWLGLRLDIATSLLSSVAIGIGVDYTIHLFWRIRSELNLGKPLTEAIDICLRNTGRGIAINAFSVMIGFSVLFLSGIIMLKTFGFLILFSLLLCLLCALILIPAILIRMKYK